MKLNIFLSYGHDIEEDAHIICQKLEESGHIVWFDRERIADGVWSKRIEDGLKQVSLDKKNSRFVYLMTPHSTREGEQGTSICLNECQSAISKGIPVFLVMIKKTDPPFILNLHHYYYDLEQCIPIKDNEKLFEAKFEKFLQSLEANTTDGFDVFLEDWVAKRLKKFDFGVKFERHLKRFTGRKWVFNDFDRWLNDSAKPVLFILGKAGTGKSAIATKLAKSHPSVKAFHFCDFTMPETRNIRNGLRNMIYFLIANENGYWDNLKNSRDEYNKLIDLANDQSEQQNLQVLFELLIRPYFKLNHQGTDHHLILIDAMDELSETDREDFINFLIHNVKSIPGNIRFAVTCRETYKNKIENRIHAKVIEISNDSPENIHDIKEYISTQFIDFNEGIELDPSIASIIVTKSEGLFLYLDYLRQWLIELKVKKIDRQTAEQLPQGLNKIIGDFFEREYTNIEQYRKYTGRILAVSFAAQHSLSLQDIMALLDIDEIDTADCQNKLGSLFSCTDSEIRPFHKSVFDWVTNPELAGKYLIRLDQGHNVFTAKGQEVLDKVRNKLIRNVSLSQLEMILLEELPYHYISLGDYHKIKEVITEIGFCTKLMSEETSKLQLITYFGEIDDPDALIPTYKANLAAFEKQNKPYDSGLAYHSVGLIYFNIGRFIQVEYFYLKALNYFKKADKKKETGKVLNDLGEIYYNYTDEIIEKVNALEKEVKSTTRAKDRIRWSFRLLSSQRKGRKYAKKAREYYIKAIKLRQNETPDDIREIAESINNLGHAYLSIGNLEKSEEQYRTALEIRKKLGDLDKDVAEGYYNLGMIRSFRYRTTSKEYKEAVVLIEKAIEINDRSKAEFGREQTENALYHYMAGIKYQGLNDDNNAIDHLEKSVILYLRAFGVKNKKTKGAFKEYEDCFLSMKKKGISRQAGDFDPVLIKESLDKRLQMLPENSPEIILIRSIFAIIYINNGLIHDAEIHLNEANDLISKIISEKLLTESYKEAIIEFYQKSFRLLVEQASYDKAVNQVSEAFKICETREKGLLSQPSRRTYIYMVDSYLAIRMNDRPKARVLVEYMKEKSREIEREFHHQQSHPDGDMFHHLAIPYNEMAFHFYVPERMWAEAENSYKKALELIHKSNLPEEVANMELNLQTVFYRSGQAVDMELVGKSTEVLKKIKDPRSEKGRIIQLIPSQVFALVFSELALGLAACDAIISNHEMEIVRNIIARTNMPDVLDHLEKIRLKLEGSKTKKENIIDGLLSNAINVTKNDASLRRNLNTMVKLLLHVSASDGKLSIEELDFIYTYTREFNMTKDDIAAILNNIQS